MEWRGEDGGGEKNSLQWWSCGVVGKGVVVELQHVVNGVAKKGGGRRTAEDGGADVRRLSKERGLSVRV